MRYIIKVTALVAMGLCVTACGTGTVLISPQLGPFFRLDFFIGGLLAFAGIVMFAAAPLLAKD